MGVLFQAEAVGSDKGQLSDKLIMPHCASKAADTRSAPPLRVISMGPTESIAEELAEPYCSLVPESNPRRIAPRHVSQSSLSSPCTALGGRAGVEMRFKSVTFLFVLHR